MAINVFKLESSKKSIFLALQSYYGLGPSLAKNLCAKFGILPSAKINELPRFKFKQLYQFMDRRLILETECKIISDVNIQKLMQIKSFRGVRLEKGQPVRGQRSRTNGSTQRHKPIKKQVEAK
jgi:small subunit ribosomal protein S13